MIMKNFNKLKSTKAKLPKKEKTIGIDFDAKMVNNKKELKKIFKIQKK